MYSSREVGMSPMPGYDNYTGAKAGSWYDEGLQQYRPNPVYLPGSKLATAARGGASPAAAPSSSLSSLGVTQASMDPWSKYRGKAGDLLATQMNPSNDPSNIYRSRLEGMVTGGSDFQTNDPSYKFRFEQGQEASERSLASRGLLNSGNAAAELQQYGQKAASQEYGAQFDRLLQGMSGVESQYNNQQQRLMAMAGVNADPTAYGKLTSGHSLGQQQITNDYSLGQQRISSSERIAQLEAESRMNSGGGGGGGGRSQTTTPFAGLQAEFGLLRSQNDYYNSQNGTGVR